MRDSVPSASYSSVCNVLRQWNIPLIPTYRVYRLYDNNIMRYLIAGCGGTCMPYNHYTIIIILLADLRECRVRML